MTYPRTSLRAGEGEEEQGDGTLVDWRGGMGKKMNGSERAETLGDLIIIFKLN